MCGTVRSAEIKVGLIEALPIMHGSKMALNFELKTLTENPPSRCNKDMVDCQVFVTACIKQTVSDSLVI